MKSRTRNTALTAAAVAGIAMLVMFIGCSEKGTGTRMMNVAPDTFISFGPTEASLNYYKVQAFWYGADEDGDVEYFEVALVKDVGRNGLDTLDLAQLDWRATAVRESTFVLRADSCCSTIDGVPEATSIWGLLVRSVDNSGEVDPTPASLFFRAGNVIPKVKITLPQKGATSFKAVPPHPYLEWQAEDADGEMSAMQYKYIVIPEENLNPQYPRLPDLSVEGGAAHAAPPAGKWSHWVPADCTYVRDLNLSIYAGTLKRIMIYVTAKDEGGAWLPENLYGSAYNNGNNWIRLVVITTGAGVAIQLDGGALGRRTSHTAAEYESNIAGLFFGTEVSFRFWGLEDRGRGELAEAYRFYFDNPDAPDAAWNYWTGIEPIRDRGQSPEWVMRYPVDGSKMVPSPGQHVYVVEIRDMNKTVTHCEFGIEVLEGPRRLTEKKILLVDDTIGKYLEPRVPDYETRIDNMWADILEGYNWEVFDTGPNFTERVPIRFVDLASTVIWHTDEDVESPANHLLQVTSALGNYLYSYVKVGGNLIIVGRNPIYDICYWPDGTPDPARRPTYTSFDFTPKPAIGDTTLMYNFMWDVFGVKKMAVASPATPFNALWPCRSGLELIPTIPPEGNYWTGRWSNTFYITEVRKDIDVRTLYSTALCDAQGRCQSAGCSRWVIVHVPGDGQRGHAALIGVPPSFFDRTKTKALIRDLLEQFGEHSE